MVSPGFGLAGSAVTLSVKAACGVAVGVAGGGNVDTGVTVGVTTGVNRKPTKFTQTALVPGAVAGVMGGADSSWKQA